MDVIQLVQSGIENVVASGGTALTINQIRLLHRFTDNIILLYDGDKAGIKAALRGIDMMLEEGINIRVILLPEGEDPDSFAKSRNASDLKEFLENNKHDFIRFKTQLLMEEAQNDPSKRSEMILQIVRSIAVIPDVIKRQVYIKDTAALLAIPEDVLTRKVTEIRQNEAEERNKKKDLDQRKQNETDEISKHKDENTLSNFFETTPNSHKEQNILNLLQVIIRYGEKILYQTEDNQNICVGEYIIQELRNDNVVIENPIYKQILEEFVQHYKEPNFFSSVYFQHHPNIVISQLAVDLIVDKYQLSRMYSKRSISENVVQEVSLDEATMLPELVQRLLYELKLTLVIEVQKNLSFKLGQTLDEGLQMILLEQQTQLKNIEIDIRRALGRQ